MMEIVRVAELPSAMVVPPGQQHTATRAATRSGRKSVREQAPLRCKRIEMRRFDIGIAISAGVASVVIGHDQHDVSSWRCVLRSSKWRKQKGSQS